MISLPTDAYAHPRIASNRTWLWFIIGLFVLMLGLLIGPRVPDDQQAARCVVNVHLPGPFGIALNCDSPEFLRLATTPSELLAPKNTRQSRPGLILAAAVLSRPIWPLLNVPKLLGIKASRADIEPSRVSGALAVQFPAYVAYIALNFLILCAAFYCTSFVNQKLFNDLGRSAQMIFASLGILIVADDVTKAYFWTPHTQMFNVFIPVFATYVFAYALNGAFHERKFAIVTGLITGFGITAYPTFVIIIPCAIFATLLAFLRGSTESTSTRVYTGLAMFVALAAAPLALWYAFIRLKTGEFHSEEIAQGPDIWIPIVFAQDGVRGLLVFFLVHFGLMLELARKQAIPIFALMAIIAAIALTNRAAVAAALHRNLLLLFSALVVDLALGSFYSLSGDMHFRWAFVLIPPLVIAAGAIILSVYHDLNPAMQRFVTSACVALAVWQVGFTIIKSGPFS